MYNKSGVKQLIEAMVKFCEDRGIVTVRDFNEEISNLLAMSEK